MNGVVSESLRLLRARLEEANATVTTPDRLPAAMCDPNLIAEVFHNLILNGLKYNQNPEKRIEIGMAAPPSGTRTTSSRPPTRYTCF